MFMYLYQDMHLYIMTQRDLYTESYNRVTVK